MMRQRRLGGGSTKCEKWVNEAPKMREIIFEWPLIF